MSYFVIYLFWDFASRKSIIMAVVCMIMSFLHCRTHINGVQVAESFSTYRESTTYSLNSSEYYTPSLQRAFSHFYLLSKSAIHPMAIQIKRTNSIHKITSPIQFRRWRRSNWKTNTLGRRDCRSSDETHCSDICHNTVFCHFLYVI